MTLALPQLVQLPNVDGLGYLRVNLLILVANAIFWILFGLNLVRLQTKKGVNQKSNLQLSLS